MIRFNKARDLIETTQMKFTDIEYLASIEEQYYFSKVFNKYVELPSTAYYKSIVSLKWKDIIRSKYPYISVPLAIMSISHVYNHSQN